MEAKTAPSAAQQLIQLAPGALLELDYVSSRFDAKAGPGVKPEDLLAPAYWAHDAVKLKPFDEIRVRADDGTWVANLMVLDCSRNWARVQQLALYRLTTADQSQTQAAHQESIEAMVKAHKVVHRGPHKWSVVREGDKAVMAEGKGTREEAQTWLEEHAKKNAAAPAVAAAPA